MTNKTTYPYNLLFDAYPNKEKFGEVKNFDELLEKIYSETGKFKARDIDCIKKYYKEGLTYSAIGKEYNISSTRVRQIIVKVLRKFHHPSILKTYFNFEASTNE